jgi:hypothetical protein
VGPGRMGRDLTEPVGGELSEGPDSGEDRCFAPSRTDRA